MEEKQIETLIRWINCYIAPSDIHGVGIFAIRDIPEGTKLYLDIMPELFRLPYKKLKNNCPAYVHDTLVSRWPRVKLGEPFVYPDARYVAYMNHGGDDANYDAINDVALRDIKEGEELTEDYRKITGARQVYDFLDVV